MDHSHEFDGEYRADSVEIELAIADNPMGALYAMLQAGQQHDQGAPASHREGLPASGTRLRTPGRRCCWSEASRIGSITQRTAPFIDGFAIGG